MAGRAPGARGSDGVDGAVLEAGVAAVGRAVPAAPGAGAIQSGAQRAQGRFSRCRAAGAPVRGGRTGSELCPGPRAAPVADTDPQQVPTHARPRPSGQSAGVSAGGRTHQAGHPGERSVGGSAAGRYWNVWPMARPMHRRWRSWPNRNCGPTRKSCATP